jgi:hypothetical protein
MSSDIPLKLKNSDGDLQKFSSSEENYLAYQLGLRLAGISVLDAGALTTYSKFVVESQNTKVGSYPDLATFESSYADSVGTYTNTFYQTVTEPIGGGSTLGLGSIATNLYQHYGLEDPEEVNKNRGSGYYQRPIRWDSDGSLIEMTSAEFTSLTTRLLSTAMTNEYPGTYRIASSAPTSEHSVNIYDVFTDTRNDGTSIDYHLYRKSSPSVGVLPSGLPKNNSVSVSYISGSYDGLKAMTETQMQYTFGATAQKIQQTAGNIGTYQLRSSAQGAPTAPGTWAARGTVTDTRNVDEQSSFVVQYVGDYIKDYGKTINYSKAYAKAYVGQYAREDFETYVKTYVSQTTFNQVLPTSYTGVRPSSYVSQVPTGYGGTREVQYGGTDPCTFAQPTSYTGSDPTSFTVPNNDPTAFYTFAPTNFTDPTVFYGQFFEAYPGSDPCNFTTPAPTSFSTSIDGSDPTSFTTFGPKIGTSVFYTTAPTTFSQTFYTTAPTTYTESQPTTFYVDFAFTASGANYFDTFAPTTFQAGATPSTFYTSDPCTFYTTDPCVFAQASSYTGTAPTSDPAVVPSSYVGTPPTTYFESDPTSYTGPTSFDVAYTGTYIKQITETYSRNYVQQYSGPELTTFGTPTTFYGVAPTVFFEPTTDDATSFTTFDPKAGTQIYFEQAPTTTPFFTFAPTTIFDPTGGQPNTTALSYAKVYAKAYAKAYTGTVVNSFVRQIETYTLYVRIS